MTPCYTDRTAFSSTYVRSVARRLFGAACCLRRRLPRNGARRQTSHRLGEVFAEIGTASNEVSEDFPLAADDHCLRNCRDAVFGGDGAVPIECDGDLPFMTIQNGGNLLGRLLQIDGDHLHVATARL